MALLTQAKLDKFFSLRQARDVIERQLDELKIEIENAVVTGQIPDTIKHQYGTGRLESKLKYEVKYLALRDALQRGQISFDWLIENDCISFKGGQLYQHMPEYVTKQDGQALVVKLEKLSHEQYLAVFCRLPKEILYRD